MSARHCALAALVAACCVATAAPTLADPIGNVKITIAPNARLIDGTIVHLRVVVSCDPLPPDQPSTTSVGFNLAQRVAGGTALATAGTGPYNPPFALVCDSTPHVYPLQLTVTSGPPFRGGHAAALASATLCTGVWPPGPTCKKVLSRTTELTLHPIR
jgi:hypothetical protein